MKKRGRERFPKLPKVGSHPGRIPRPEGLGGRDGTQTFGAGGFIMGILGGEVRKSKSIERMEVPHPRGCWG